LFLFYYVKFLVYAFVITSVEMPSWARNASSDLKQRRRR